MKISAVVVAEALLLLVAPLFAEAAQRDARDAAIKWAVAARPAAYDSLMPPAREDFIRDPICRVTTLRSPGATDAFEFAVTLTEHCDGTVAGTVVIPKHEPLTVQIARARLADPTLSIGHINSILKVERRAIPAAVVNKLLRDIAAARVSPLADDVMKLDLRRYELTSASWTSFRVDFFEGSAWPGGEKLMSIVRSALKAASIDQRNLAFDVSRIERE